MTKTLKKLYLQQKKRSLRKIIGNFEKPRLAVFRSHKHIYGQIIDDINGQTLAFSSTLEKEVAKQIESTSTCKAAFAVGESLAQKALTKNVKKVVFDRGNKPYHGRIKTLADGARAKGLEF